MWNLLTLKAQEREIESSDTQDRMTRYAVQLRKRSQNVHCCFGMFSFLNRNLSFQL